MAGRRPARHRERLETGDLFWWAQAVGERRFLMRQDTQVTAWARHGLGGGGRRGGRGSQWRLDVRAPASAGTPRGTVLGHGARHPSCRIVPTAPASDRRSLRGLRVRAASTTSRADAVRRDVTRSRRRSNDLALFDRHKLEFLKLKCTQRPIRKLQIT
jgi:hypothetical protein